MIVALLLSLVTLPAFAIDDSDLLRRQADQRQARSLARELVSTVLDLQLRQLEENGLTDLPIYGDIRDMRADLSGIVETEMADVVERLVEAQQATGTDRETKFVEARRAIRDVVVRLSVERQELLRRLKAAEIAEQARRLIELQTAARDATAALPSLPDDRRPKAALRTIEDQRDVKELFLRLVETLTDVKTWDGPVATAASDGLRVLTEADAGRRLDEADRTLAAAAFAEAVSHQDAVLDALRKLLAMIENTQGAADAAKNDLAEAIRRLREEQQALHEQVKNEGLSEPPKPETVEAQQSIANTIAEFADELAGDATAAPLRDQAEAAARAATEALFTADEDRTLAEQQRAIDRLASLEAALREGTGEEQRDRSAAEFAEAIRDLEQAREELKQAATKHDEAVRERAAKPQAAAEAEKAAAEQAAKIDEEKELPAAVTSRIKDAAEASKNAAEALAEAASDSPAAEGEPPGLPRGDDLAGSPAGEKGAEAALAESGDAFQRAQAAVEEALADAKRAEAAVRIGELARAAEAIERAAAAERELAAEAAQASRGEGLSPEQTEEMKRVQADVTAVAAKTAEGVRAAAPEAAETLAKALDAAKQTDAALSQAAEASGGRQPPGPRSLDVRSDQGADAPRSPEHADAVAHHATDAARSLAEAAASLRREIGETADELANVAGEQLTPVAAAQQAVEKAAEALDAEPQQAAEAAARATQASAQAETGATSATQAAEKALAGQGTPADASDALDRAAVSLAAREQRLRQDQQLARRLAQIASRQQSASEAIAQARQNLTEAPSDPAAMSPQQREDAKTLHAATRQFAAAQRATGQGAAQVSGQRQVMNAPIREALQTAERLPVPQMPGEPVDTTSQTAEGTPAGEGNQPPGPNQPSQNSGTPSESANASQQTASSGAEGNSSSAASSSPNGMPQPTGLGTGLVPAAPDETARMMAGPEAQAALAAMAAAGIESMEDIAASETAPEGELPEGTALPEGADPQTAAAQGRPADGSPADSDSQMPDAAGRDATAGDAGGTDAGWFAKLPPEVRAAIRASSSQPAPMGYEGRLKRYFESVE